MKIYGSRDAFYQWDVNQKITSAKLREGDEVHFANDRSGEAIVVKAYKHNHIVVADVPNILLQQTNKILAYRYVTDGVSELTVCERTFDVVARPKPADYIYTETDCVKVESFVAEAVKTAFENAPFIPSMSVIDEEERNLDVENYKNGKTFPDTYNRVYVELSNGRGVYGRFCLTAVDAPLDPDPEDYAKGKTLDSIPMRMSNGYIMSPIIRADDVEALAKLAELGYNTDYYLMPKSYIDSLVAKLFAIGENGGLKHGQGAENSGKCNLSVGVNTKASAAQASAFGDATEATAWTAFAINRTNKAKNAHSFVGGIGNESSRDGQTVLGRYAKPDANYNFLVGVGDSETNRINGFGVMWDGRVLIGKDPTAPMHAVPKHQLDELGNAILDGLGSIITAQNELLGG